MEFNFMNINTLLQRGIFCAKEFIMLYFKKKTTIIKIRHIY